MHVVEASVYERDPRIQSQVARIPAAHAPLRGYASFVSDPMSGIEDVVIAIDCFYEPKGMRCQSDIAFADQKELVEGPEWHFRQDKIEETVQAEIDAWLADTQRFILANRDAI